jgi:hypothetical protein
VGAEGGEMSEVWQLLNPFGSHLTEADYQGLAACWIPHALADAARLRRVDSYTGREMFTRKSGDYGGIIIPYAPPAENRYFPPGLPAALLTDPSLLLIITEGEFKALALWRLANHQTTSPRFLPVSVAGANNWRGTIGKTEGPNGDRRDVKGVIPDIERIVWKDRK